MNNIDSYLQKFSKYTSYNSKLENASKYKINSAPIEKPSGVINNENIPGEIFSIIKKQKIKIYLFYGIIIFLIYIVLKEVTYDITY